MAFDAGRIEGTLDLDRSPFQRGLTAAKTEARQFADGKYAATLDADTRSADAKILDLRARLDRLSTDRVTPRVDLDGFAEAEVRVKLLQEQLDKLSRTRVTPSIGGSGGAGGGGLFSRLAGFGRGGFFGGMGLLGVAGASAAVPVGVAGLGLGASFLSPAVAGTAGLGLFGAASKSAIDRVEKVQKQLDALNKRIAAQGGAESPERDKLVEQRKQLLDQLTPAERKASEEIEKFEHTWKHFQRALEPETFKLVATGADIFRKGLHDLLPMTKAVGDEVDDLAKRADKALSDPFWQHFFGDFLTKEAPRAVDALGTTIGNVVTGIAHLAQTWAPLGHSLDDEMVSISGNFEKWTEGQGPGAFMALVRRDGPVVGRALVAIGNGIGGIAKGIEPIGRIELQALTPVLNFIGDLGEQDPKVITALGIAYLSVAGGLKAIAAVRGISGAINTIRGIGSGKVPGGGAGGAGGGLLGRGGNPAEPLYVFVVNEGGGVPGGGKEPEPLPTGGKKPSRLGSLKNILPGKLVYAETYLATQGGDQAPGQTPLGASRIRNGPAITRLISQVGPRIPTNQGQDFFTGPLDAPGGRAVNPSALVSNTLTYGTTGEIHELETLAKSYPSIESALMKQQHADAQEQADLLRQLLGKNGSPGPAPTIFDLRGATFTNVNNPQELERLLRSKQRLANLGPGIGIHVPVGQFIR